MSEIISIPILELMEKTEQWLLNQGYKKNTLGVYKATWNKFRACSSSRFYDRGTQKLPGDMLVYSSDNCFISGTGTKA